MDIIKTKTTEISVGVSFTNDEIARINTDGTVDCNWPLIEQVAASWAPYKEDASSYFAKVLLSLKSNVSSQCYALTKELAAVKADLDSITEAIILRNRDLNSAIKENAELRKQIEALSLNHLQVEVWECHGCGKCTPCRVEITFKEDRTLPEYLKGEQRFSRMECLCNAFENPKVLWERVPNTTEHQQGTRQGGSNE